MSIAFNITNRFSGKIQFTAQIDCHEDALKSIKIGLAVKWALECGADLSGAHLGRADLSGAYLSGAYLGRAKISDLATLGFPNGWGAYTYITEAGEQLMQVGCRNFTLAQGRFYWANKQDRREVLAALDYAEAIAKIRKWGAVAVSQAAE